MAMKYKANKKILFIDLILLLLFIASDQIAKYYASISLKNKDAYVLINKVFEFRYLENKGAAFGMLQNCQWLFILIGLAFIVAAVIALIWIPTDKKYRLLRIALVMMVSGAIGNIIDRALYNYVVDFLYFVYIDFPIFNVADCYVTVGTVLLVLLILFYYKDDDLDFKKARVRKIHSSMIQKEEN